MFISDIHGSHHYMKQAIEMFKKEGADKLVILGDVLYHGPRNPLTKEYSPMDVYSILNEYQDDIIAVRGNCDSEVDQMVLEFPVMDDYQIIDLGNRKLFITHGHLYDENKMPDLQKGDVFIHGHYHVHISKLVDGVHYLNAGSISLPKETSCNSYGIIEDDLFMIKDLNGNVVTYYPFDDNFRFYLRNFTINDAADIFENMNDKIAFNCGFKNHLEVSETEAVINDVFDVNTYAICDKETNELIGNVSHRIPKDCLELNEKQYREFGYYMFDKSSGKNIMSQALEFLMSRLNFDNYVLAILDDNIASCRVAEKNGFIDTQNPITCEWFNGEKKQLLVYVK